MAANRLSRSDKYNLYRLIFTFCIIIAFAIITYFNGSVKYGRYMEQFNPNTIRIRCKIRKLGCFEKKSHISLLEGKMIELDDVKSPGQCLHLCSEIEENWSPSFVAMYEGRCTCGLKLNATSFNQTVLSLVTEADGCRSKNQIELYKVTHQCEKDTFSFEKALQHHYGGCYREPPDFEDLMGVGIKDSRITPAYCVLHCEHFNYTLAITKYPNMCYCGNTTRRFYLQNPVQDEHCLRYYNKSSMAWNLEVISEFVGLRPIAVWRTFADDLRCSSRRLINRTQKFKFKMAGISGSGFGWVRSLLESASGIYTGGSLQEEFLQRGMIGEFMGPSLITRFMYEPRRSKFNATDRIVLVIRDPFEVIEELFTAINDRQNLSMISNQIRWEGPKEWHEFVYLALGEWLEVIYMVLREQPFTMVVYYEDLLEQRSREIRRIVTYLNLEVDDLEDRLLCMNSEVAEFFHDQSLPEIEEPYTPDMITVINEAIKTARAKLTMAKKPTLPVYERVVTQCRSIEDDGESQVHKHIDRSKESNQPECIYAGTNVDFGE